MKFTKKDKEVFKGLGINTIYLFGSRALGLESESSDYDIAILFSDTSKLAKKKDGVYLEIYELIADRARTKRDIDIVFLHRASGQLRYHVVSNGVVLHDADPRLRGDFEERVISEHADFEYFRKMFEKAIMERAA